MKARLIRNGSEVHLLCSNGTISKAPPSLLTHFLSHFDEVGIFTGKDGTWSDRFLDMSVYPGETLAYVTDNNQLVVLSPWVIETVIKKNVVAPKELTIVEYAKKHDRSKEMIKALLREGRIAGAIMRGRQWFIPENAPYPIEERSRKPTAGRTPVSNED